MKLASPIWYLLLSVAVCTAVSTTLAMGAEQLPPADDAKTWMTESGALVLTDEAVSVDDIEGYRLADRSNLRRLPNGDFMFRVGRDKKSAVVYWAYMGNSKNIVAVVPSTDTVRERDAAIRVFLAVTKLPQRVACGAGLVHTSNVVLDAAIRVFLAVTKLPQRVACGAGLVHTSNVVLVPETPQLLIGERYPHFDVVYASGVIRNDLSGKSPTMLRDYRNNISASHLHWRDKTERAERIDR